MPPVADLQNRRLQVENNISILPYDYFNKIAPTDAQAHAEGVTSIVTWFKLNLEQERAFRIVADHASTPQRMPLRMYLGGMGGTGKSQVLKSITAFFVMRKEEYRYMILGPTGSVAALLNGSTYHSVFKIPRESKNKNRDDIDGIRNESAAIAAVNERLQGVDYIFLDEISMVSCNDLQMLATQ
ncbi:hypothetical protein C8R44DRAFT_641175, partial [Mycena epipterygia]